MHLVCVIPEDCHRLGQAFLERAFHCHSSPFVDDSAV
jgi:hypothetical protein